jgi:hypothetical protein
MPSWVPAAGVCALVGILYLAKAAILLRRPSVSAACLWYVTLLALAVPVTWAIDHDWDNLNWYPIAHWVGAPVTVLTVPATSFVIDLLVSSDGGRQRSRWWVPLELFIAFPAWFVFWTYFSFFGLGWGWI